MQRGVAVKVSFQADRASEGQLDAFGLGQLPQSQFPGCAHREVPLLKNSG